MSQSIRSLAERVASGECGEYIYCLQNGKFYIYEKGYWRDIQPVELLAIIENGIIDIRESKDQDGNVIEQIPFKTLTKFQVNNRKQILEELKLLNYKKLSEFNWADLINFENCMFSPVSLNTEDHNKIFYSTIRVPYIYDKSARCDLWFKTLKEIFENDYIKIKLLQEFFGYCLTKDVKMEKSLLLLGESRSGKSTILNTLQYLIGDENCSHVGLMNLENPQYTSMMINKLVNIDGEVSKKAADYESQFKTIVTGHEVNCNDKYVAPFKFRPYCKFVMSANEFPKITDHSSAFYKRLMIIPCNRVFNENEQNRNLRNELLKELPGILNWAVEGLKVLNTRGHFEQYEFMRDAIQELEDENNPTNLFFEEHVEVAVGEWIEKGELFKKYQEWCNKNNNYALSQNRFSMTVYKKYNLQTVKNARLDNNGKRIWKNINYVPFKSGIKTQEIKWEDNITSTAKVQDGKDIIWG